MRLRTVAVAHTDPTGSHRIALVDVKSHRILTWWIVAHTDPTDLTGLL